MRKGDVRIGLVLTGAVDAGVAGTLVVLREAHGVVEAIGADASERVHAIHTGATVAAWVRHAVIDVNVTCRS